jgi:hypothetical protein
MYTIGYDFGDTFVEAQGIQVAIRLSTDGNVYCPARDDTTICRSNGQIRLYSSRLSAAGGQITSEGNLELLIDSVGNEQFRVSGRAFHPNERCKAILILLKGLDVDSFVSESENMPKRFFQGNSGISPLVYPGRDATMPLVFIETKDGDEWYALSRDDNVRRKAFSAYYDGGIDSKIVMLAYEEDRRRWAHHITLPAWQIGKSQCRLEVVRERCKDLESKFGLVPFHARRRYELINEIKLIVNFHGEHWTGHVFNTFADMKKQLQWVCSQIESKHVIAFLPAWDGRYYVNYPLHWPSQRMGGEEGLKDFIHAAHQLGVKVIPMLGGPNLATFEFLEQTGLSGAALKNSQGIPLLQDWVDWNSDTSRECLGYIVNYGHPGLQKYMFSVIRRLYDDYGFDGVFFDGAIRWSNAPDYSPLEGIIELAEAIETCYPEKILMAEDGYDVLWGVFDLFATSWGPLGLEKAMLRYTRQTEYLAFPSVSGSGGVHEVAWTWENIDKSISEFTIPTLNLLHGDIELYGQEIEGRIRQHKAWRQSLPPICSES